MKNNSYVIIMVFFIFSLGLYAGENTKKNESFIEVSGSKSSIFNYGFYGAGNAGFLNGFTRSDSMSLRLSGSLLGDIKVFGSFFQSDSELENKYSLNFTGQSWKLDLGDVNTGTGGSKFSLYSRFLTGANFETDIGNFRLNAVAAVPKGKAVYERIFGNGTQGPFLIRSVPLVPGSERIMLAGEKLLINEDYTINYTSGQILFKKAVLENTDYMDITYEVKNSFFERFVYGGEVSVEADNLFLDLKARAGAGYFAEQDAVDGSRVIYEATGVSPTSDVVLNFNAGLSNEVFRLEGECAFSENKKNILEGERFFGDAYGLKGALSIFDLKITGNYSKTNDKFASIGSAGLDGGTELHEYKADFKTGGIITAAAGYRFEKNIMNEIRRRIKKINGEFSLEKSGMPYVNYMYLLSEENNEDIYPNNIERKLFRHTGSVNHNFTFLNIGSEYSWEKSDGIFGAEPGYISRRIKVFASSHNTGAFNARAEAEYDAIDREETIFEDAAAYNVLTLNGNVNFSIAPILKLNAANVWKKDDFRGDRYIVDTMLELIPFDFLKTTGSYSLQTLSQQVGSVQQTVYTESWSGNTEVNPHKTLRMTYRPSGKGAKILETGKDTHYSYSHNITFDYAPVKTAAFTGDYLLDRYILNNSAEPSLPLQLRRDSKGVTLSLKFTPVMVVSAEIAYADRYLEEENYDFISMTSEVIAGCKKDASVNLATSLAENFSVTAGYSFNESIKGGSDNYKSITETPYEISELNKTINHMNSAFVVYSENTASHTFVCGISRQWFEWLKIFISTDYNQKIDRIFKQSTKTFAPGCKIELMIEKFNMNLSYKAGFSSGASDIFQEAYIGNINYNLYKTINISVNGTHTKSINPDTNTTNITGNFSMNF